MNNLQFLKCLKETDKTIINLNNTYQNNPVELKEFYYKPKKYSFFKKIFKYFHLYYFYKN